MYILVFSNKDGRGRMRSRDANNSPFRQGSDGVNLAVCSEDTSDGFVYEIFIQPIRY